MLRSVEKLLAKQTILLVDDDDEVREILAETLEDFGYRVIGVSSGEEALLCLDHDDMPDMIISDIRMPGMSGLELAERVRARGGCMKLLLISGYFLPQQISERFLRKPFHRHELESAVRAQLG